MPDPDVIRSYQRIFRPERRLYQIEGRRLPVPGGVPLRWLGWAGASLIAVLALSAGSRPVTLAVALGAAAMGLAAGGPRTALLLAGLGVVAVPIAQLALGLFDWPLRLVVLPGLVATLATQATPDGRPAQRFAWSWLLTRLSARRRSLGRSVPEVGTAQGLWGEVWVAGCDGPLRRGRVRGPATVSFSTPVALRRGRLRRRRLVASGLGERSVSHSPWARRVEVAAGEVLEVRP